MQPVIERPALSTNTLALTQQLAAVFQQYGRRLNEISEPAVNVTQFGAIGDGRDDSRAIQYALDAKGAELGRIHFPARNRSGRTVYAANGLVPYSNTIITADP